MQDFLLLSGYLLHRGWMQDLVQLGIPIHSQGKVCKILLSCSYFFTSSVDS